MTRGNALVRVSDMKPAVKPCGECKAFECKPHCFYRRIEDAGHERRRRRERRYPVAASVYGDGDRRGRNEDADLFDYDEDIDF